MNRRGFFCLLAGSTVASAFPGQPAKPPVASLSDVNSLVTEGQLAALRSLVEESITIEGYWEAGAE